MDIRIVVVILQQDLSESEQAESWPEVFLNVDEPIICLHKHIIAQTALPRGPH